ncbi:MAG TPA: hypothetical protein VGB50_09410 [Flavobacterium sp.]|jgi:hypothetical protein
METKRFENSFRLLTKHGKRTDSFTLGIRVGGYNDVMHYISSAIKVCILALEGQEISCSRHIPQPEVNISSVLEMLLNMIPYEECELLDELHDEFLNPQDDDGLELLEMNLWLTPSSMDGQ